MSQLKIFSYEFSYYLSLYPISIFVSSVHSLLYVLLSSTRGHRAITVASWFCIKAWQTKGEEEMFLQTEI